MSFAFIRKSLQRLRWRSRRPDDPSQLGRLGEQAAARFLRKRRHRILARNFRCAVGEVDIITLDGDTVVFVEVKTRTSTDRQDPLETVGLRKWRRVERAARSFALQLRERDYAFRFDFIAVVWPESGNPTIEHVADAYHPRGG